MNIKNFIPVKWENEKYTIEYKKFNGTMQYVLYNKVKNCMEGFNTDLQVVLSFIK